MNRPPSPPVLAPVTRSRARRGAATKRSGSPSVVTVTTTTIAVVIASIVSALAFSACGETYDLADVATTLATDRDPADTGAIDTGSIDAGSIDDGAAPTDDDPPIVDAGSSTEELLDALIIRWQGLDDAAIEGEPAPFEQLQTIWILLEVRLRDERPELVYGFEQALALAESALEFRRPADASKGYAIAARLAAQYGSTG